VVFVTESAPLALAGETKTASPVRTSLSSLALLSGRMRKGEEDAFALFYDQYGARLLAYLFVLTRGDQALSRELCQQTMIRVAKYIREFTDEEQFWAWIASIARSCWADEGRKSKRYFAMLERLWNWQSRGDSSDDANNVMSQGLERLPEEDRELLKRKYLEGESVREIAASQGVTEKAIESRLSRVREKLKVSLLCKTET
jgi:RNA polymerase sigma-70 factor (ECF subfamily)